DRKPHRLLAHHRQRGAVRTHPRRQPAIHRRAPGRAGHPDAGGARHPGRAGHHHLDGERSAGPPHPRVHHRRHRPDARRHHQRVRGPRLRRALGGPRGNARSDGGRLRAARPAGGVQRGADADGDPAARRGAHPLRRDQRARLLHGQRPRHGRRAAHHALHVRGACAEPGARAADLVADRACARGLRGQHRRRPGRDPVAPPRARPRQLPLLPERGRRRRGGAGRQGHGRGGGGGSGARHGGTVARSGRGRAGRRAGGL
ncbi:MAG: ADP-ribose pyrophosphatase of COG1058 family, partial [uncultured Acetobacteraceae bacterium]